VLWTSSARSSTAFRAHCVTIPEIVEAGPMSVTASSCPAAGSWARNLDRQSERGMKEADVTHRLRRKATLEHRTRESLDVVASRALHPALPHPGERSTRCIDSQFCS
jgi:hypothetical protein